MMTDAEREANGAGSYADAIGTLRKLEIARAALVRIMADSAKRNLSALDDVYWTAHDALFQMDRNDPVKRG